MIGGNDLDGFHEIRISKDRSIWVSTLEIRVVRKGKEIFHTRMDDIYLVRVLKQIQQDHDNTEIVRGTADHTVRWEMHQDQPVLNSPGP